MFLPKLRRLCLTVAVGALLTSSAVAQLVNPAPEVAPPATAPGGEAKTFKPEELEQLAAPIALYPDSLVAQVLMASTYPVEVVQADRWRAANKEMKGEALALELNKKDWDPSVKSLVDFPQVLDMMSQQLDWTTKLGDAFLADQTAIMNAVQRLRAKAKAQGNLKETPEQKVTEQASTTVVVEQGSPPPPQIITIESKSPEVVYVPTYNPTVVYGTWPYPTYPPPPAYYPPGYVASNLISFGAGVAVGAAWGHAWGNCNWGGGNVDVDVNRNTNFNSNIDRTSAKANLQSRAGTAAGAGNRANTFQHDPAHRKGASYRDGATANRVNSPQNRQAAAARDSFRGRADAGRQDIARGGADGFRGGNTPGAGGGAAGGGGNRPSIGGGAAGGGGNRPALGGGAAGGGARPSAQPAPSRGGGSGFSGVNNSGASARAASSRGQASRSSPSPSRSAPARSSGGGGRRR